MTKVVKSKDCGNSPKNLFVQTLANQAPLKIEVEHAISDGRSGAANGIVQLASGTRIRFCHVIEFGSAKGDSVARITSYYVDDVSGLEA